MVDYAWDEDVGGRQSKMEELIGRAPDPVADRRALSVVRNAASPAFRRFVGGLYLREDRGHSHLGALLPGLALLRSPRLADQLGVRAVNALSRAKLANWSALAASAPASLAGLPGVGPEVLEEILSVAAREWAGAYLDASEGPQLSERPFCPNPGRPARPNSPDDLARAFVELEQTPYFDVLKRRQLDPGNAASGAVLAAERGVSKQRVSKIQVTVRERLAKQMQDPDWPIGVAVEAIRDRLGAVAQTEEVNCALEAIDPHGIALPAAMPHRRVLLLELAEYRVMGEWALGPDVEQLTRVVLEAVADAEAADLRSVGRHLSRLGVREEVQLRWILHQWGFRIVDGEVRRLVEG